MLAMWKKNCTVGLEMAARQSKHFCTSNQQFGGGLLEKRLLYCQIVSRKKKKNTNNVTTLARSS